MTLKKIKNKAIIIGCFLFFVATACHHSADNFRTSSFSKIEVIPVKLDSGWGYKIAINGKTFIYQKQIPAIQGVHVFPDKESAVKVGNLVAYKISQAQIPSVSVAEIKKVLPSL